MTTNTNEKAAGVLDTPATANFKIDTSILSPTEKEFRTVAAQFVLKGHTLHSTRDAGGTATYLAERWGLVRYLPTLDDARRFLAQIGGTA